MKITEGGHTGNRVGCRSSIIIKWRDHGESFKITASNRPPAAFLIGSKAPRVVSDVHVTTEKQSRASMKCCHSCCCRWKNRMCLITNVSAWLYLTINERKMCFAKWALMTTIIREFELWIPKSKYSKTPLRNKLPFILLSRETDFFLPHFKRTRNHKKNILVPSLIFYDYGSCLH